VNTDNLLDFLKLAIMLKTISRTGWIESGIKNPESIADHSFLTALTAMVLSDSMGLDTCKVMRMALFHDLAEVEIGDITPEQKTSNHGENEDKAMKKIFNFFDKPFRELYWEIWVEYKNKETLEAILVHDSDKIDMVLQALEYLRESNIKKLERFLHTQVSSNNQGLIDTIKSRNCFEKS
jgi:putative hydrolase of HD superfamily